MKVKNIAVDADSLLYETCPGVPADALEGETLDQLRTPMKTLLNAFTANLELLLIDLDVALMVTKFRRGEVELVFSDPKGNFRYDLFPDYKANRKGRECTPDFYRLRKKLHKMHTMVEGFEADDIVADRVRHGAIGISLDKDLLKGVKGWWFDSYTARRSLHKTKGKEAKHFTLLQSLAGDPADGIPGIHRVGMKTAENLLVSNGDNWKGVVKSYKNAGLTKKDAILTRRLVGMDQYKKGKLKLFKA